MAFDRAELRGLDEAVPVLFRKAGGKDDAKGDLGDEVKMPAFWQYARATKYSDIPASMYDSLDKMLSKKEGNGR